MEVQYWGNYAYYWQVINWQNYTALNHSPLTAIMWLMFLNVANDAAESKLSEIILIDANWIMMQWNKVKQFEGGVIQEKTNFIIMQQCFIITFILEQYNQLMFLHSRLLLPKQNSSSRFITQLTL